MEAPNSEIGPMDLPVTKAPAGGACVTNPPRTVVVSTLKLPLVSKCSGRRRVRAWTFFSPALLSGWNFLLIPRVFLFFLFRPFLPDYYKCFIRNTQYDDPSPSSAHC